MSDVWGPTQCIPGAAANLTSPCLVTTCSNDDTGGVCAGVIQLCNAGSQDYTSYFNRSTSHACQFYCAKQCVSNCDPNYASSEVDSCGLKNLGGTLAGSGTAWSLYDDVNTYYLDYEAKTDAETGAPYTIFYVDLTDDSITSALTYFAAQAGVESPQTSTSSAAVGATPSTTVTPTSTPLTSLTSAAGLPTSSSAVAYVTSAAMTTTGMSTQAVAASTSTPATTVAGTTAATIAAASSSAKASSGPHVMVSKALLFAMGMLVMAMIM